jgi:hypothetical protein
MTQSGHQQPAEASRVACYSRARLALCVDAKLLTSLMMMKFANTEQHSREQNGKSAQYG